MELSNASQMALQAKERTIASLFTNDDRAKSMSIKAASLFLDYSKQNINDDELATLFSWAKEQKLTENITRMFAGEKINNTENRAVLHTVLRAPNSVKQTILKTEADEVIETEKRVEQIVNNIRSGKSVSAAGKRFTDVLVIGIGGSFYGVKVALSALNPFCSPSLSVHVLANIDGGAVHEKLAKLSVDTTLVIVISKTFTTQETMLNAQAVKQWMRSNANNELIDFSELMQLQWYAVSTNITKATEFGLSATNVLPMWDWVGGRFSLWSAVGLPLALAIGNNEFSQLKNGAYEMDQHFLTSQFEQNMPVIMALVGLWNRNVLGHSSLAILPYDHGMRALPGYLQQTDMESNGKSVNKQGDHLSCATAPIVFGQEGTNSQHAFMQLMHQSNEIIPTDFIVALQGSSDLKEHHKVLVANCFAQSEALMKGKTLLQAQQELIEQNFDKEDAEQLAPHKVMKGNTPSNMLLLDKVTPYSFGALLALYEHKIAVQGFLWNINSFDQWGVELGKQLGQQILAVIDGGEDVSLSSSTTALISQFKSANFCK
ncbi:glucose-6-phosphate isomerase [Thalassotalea piscium]|uniref:Glucose-6-phosphate isomerase n=1 Tax=Thalassotalea piscium TaxID=1230533 RepID=A0A7X0TS70_9GAMM|nr:glucose-6-phosphate isomerase [Thalassotalea piscium]MBB6541831.1 glucose-6-phosphate isomerase [Thalassotalea piscium]